MRAMRRSYPTFVLLLCILLLAQPLAVSAITSSEAKQAWYEAKETSRDAQAAHRQAKIAYAADRTPENEQRVIDTGKDALHAALDEAEAWLVWKDLEVDENPGIPQELKATIGQDVETNLAKIEELRDEVDGIDTRLELGLVFLKMVGKYAELLTDVARDTGFVWVHLMTMHADTVEEYEQELRTVATGMPDNDDILEALDSAAEELASARENIDQARAEYEEVRLPGTPLIKFSNGNNYLRIAKGNLLSAHGYLNQAYAAMVRGGGSR
jgi:hypothetical protein